jgi:hypothetical protein
MGTLKHLLYLDDRQIAVEFGAGATSRRVTLADAESQESAAAVENGTFVDRRTYLLEGLRVVKEVTLPEGSNLVTVSLLVESASGPVGRIVVPVQPAMQTVVATGGEQQAQVAFRGLTAFGGDWWGSVLIDATSDGGKAATLAVSASDSITVAEVRPESPRAELTLAFTLRGRPSGTGGDLQSFTADDVIRQDGITFTVVDKQPAAPWFGDPLSATALAWLEGAPYFRPLWEEGNVAAYLVAPATPDEQPLALEPETTTEAVDGPR